MQNCHRKCIRRAAMVIRHHAAHVIKADVCDERPAGYRNGLIAGLRHTAEVYEENSRSTISLTKRLVLDSAPQSMEDGERLGQLGGILAGLGILNEIASGEGITNIAI